MLSLAFCPPTTLATASYDGDIVVWNLNSEQASRHLSTHARRVGTRSSRRNRRTVKTQHSYPTYTETGKPTPMDQPMSVQTNSPMVCVVTGIELLMNCRTTAGHLIRSFQLDTASPKQRPVESDGGLLAPAQPRREDSAPHSRGDQAAAGDQVRAAVQGGA